MKIGGWRDILSRGDCRAKVPEQGMSLVCSLQSKGAAWLEQSG